MRRIIGLPLLASLGLAHPFSGGGFVQGDLKFGKDDAPKTGEAMTVVLNTVTLADIPVNLQDCHCFLLLYEGQTAGPSQTPNQVIRLTLDPKTSRLGGNLTFSKIGMYVAIVQGRPLPGKKMPAFLMSSLVMVSSK